MDVEGERRSRLVMLLHRINQENHRLEIVTDTSGFVTVFEFPPKWFKEPIYEGKDA